MENEEPYRNAVGKFHTTEMDLPSETLKSIVLNTRAKCEQHMLIVMDKSTHEKNLSPALQTKNKQVIIAVTAPTGYNGIFNVRNTNNNFCFANASTEYQGRFYPITLSTRCSRVRNLE